MVNYIDLLIFNFFYSFTGFSSIIDGVIIFLATYLPYLMGLGAIFFIGKQPSSRQKFFVFIFMALTLIFSWGLLAEAIRFIYNRPRPFEVLGLKPLVRSYSFSFPSGHAVFFFTLALVIFYFNRKWGAWFLGLALLNGLARIIAGLHWPTDILGGIIVALFSFLVIKELLKGKKLLRSNLTRF